MTKLAAPRCDSRLSLWPNAKKVLDPRAPTKPQTERANHGKKLNVLDMLPERRWKMYDPVKGRSLVWVLSQIRGMAEAQAVERLEQRLEELAPAIEGKSPHAYTTSDRQARAAH